MVNVNKLKGKIVEKEYTIDSLAELIGVNRSTLYRKISNGGENILIWEADAIVKALGLNCQEACAIFFNQFVA